MKFIREKTKLNEMVIFLGKNIQKILQSMSTWKEGIIQNLPIHC